ncbi:CoA-acylating methylmalonate-semialdehyde dehydrogenase, partial [Candidatus Poribacteria bacterium]|nr:CoA-acylating methylmalonate-semialdehyde dehydrogenase [Candidatus Poribacteria bacterium]
GEAIAAVPLSPASDVDRAVDSASKALKAWRHVPAVDRVQCLYRLKTLMEESAEDIARAITLECGKTLSESRGEVLRAIQNVEVACGIPTMMQGSNLEDIASGIDEHMIRQPVGVCAFIAPFNFPCMIPFWFLPYAIACGNTCVVKPSERVPLTMQKVFALIEQIGLPDGVVNLVNGGRDTVDAILEHPEIRAISFVGSSAVARQVYAKAAANGKRVQCQGGAKNPMVIMPDADPDMTRANIAESAFGCAGQRCLAASLAFTIGDARDWFPDVIRDAAESRVVGNGLDEATEMGPVITRQSHDRIRGVIDGAAQSGVALLAGGRDCSVSDHDGGYFLAPTVLDGVDPGSDIASAEIFGPVLTLMHMDELDDAIASINSGRYGNMACLFTSSGGAARKFRHDVDAGNVGINIGVAAPMPFFPFSGWKDSFFGDLHGQGWDSLEFFTQKKVVVERWF